MEWIRRQVEPIRQLREGQDFFYCLRPFRLIAGYPASYRTGPARVELAVRCAAYVAYLATLIHKLCYTLYQPEDINYISFVSGGAGTMAGVLIVMLIFTVHYDTFRELQDFLNDRSFARGHPLAGTIRERCYRWSSYIIIGPQFAMVLVFLQAIFTEQFRKRHTMLVIRGEPVGTDFQQAMYVMALYPPSVGFFMASTLVIALMFGLLGEMELLATRLGELDETVTRRLADREGEASQKCFWDVYLDELRICAKRHCQIFEMLKKMQRISSLVFLQHHFFSLTLVASGSYTTIRANAMRENIVFTEYPISLVVLYFTFCLLVEKLQDMNNTIGKRLYATKWMLQLRYTREFHREYRSAALTIGLLLGRSQQRIRFTSGSINEISMAKFTDFINLNYSIVMFFINMK